MKPSKDKESRQIERWRGVRKIKPTKYQHMMKHYLEPQGRKRLGYGKTVRLGKVHEASRASPEVRSSVQWIKSHKLHCTIEIVSGWQNKNTRI